MTPNLYELRIQYSQNGRVVSDEHFRDVLFYWTRQDEHEARVRAAQITLEHECGRAQVYVRRKDDPATKTFLVTECAPDAARFLEVGR